MKETTKVVPLITKHSLLISIVGLLLACTQQHGDSVSHSAYVNPFHGVSPGNVYVGACLPFGAVQLGPDVIPPQSNSGYVLRKPIWGFSHNHVSGAGGGARYGNFLFTPDVDTVSIFPALEYEGKKEYQKNEYARPGYYSVTLVRPKGEILAELTTTKHCGMHRYTFYSSDRKYATHLVNDDNKNISSTIVINAGHFLSRKGKGSINRSNTKESGIRILSDSEVEGYGVFEGGWGGPTPYKAYFVAQFSQAFTSFATWNDSVVYKGTKEINGTYTGAYVRFDQHEGDQVLVKVGLSYESADKARAYLEEIKGWDFDSATMAAEEVWNAHLGKIEVKGGTLPQRALFYTSLYQTMIMPTDLSEENPFQPNDKPYYWNHYTFWDVPRSVMPLHTLIIPDRQRSIINGLLNIYEQKGWLPDAWTAGDYADVQGGDNVEIVLADAILKDLGGFDEEKAYQALVKHADSLSPDPGKMGRHPAYREYGYCPAGIMREPVNRTVEYAYNDFCIALAAEKLVKNNDYLKYKERSNSSFHLFHDSVGHVWAKDTLGNWMPNPSLYNTTEPFWEDPYFGEGDAMTYSLYYLQNIKELIQRMGGKEAYINYLDEIFDGKFNMSNEPLFLVPYMYHYACRPDKTALQVSKIIREQYHIGSKGKPGQDDSGSIGSWYCFSAMGFFPVAGQGLYLIGSPLFDESVLHLENENKFIIKANGLSASNIYVQSATLDGKTWDRAWFKHSDIKNGATLELTMGPEPSSWGKSTPPFSELPEN